MLAALIAGTVAFLIGGLMASINPSHHSVRPPNCGLSTALAPSCGAWWGTALPNVNADLASAVSAEQTATGRRLDIVHTYHRWRDVFPTASERQIALSGHLLFENWEPRDSAGHPIRWADIAAGHQDAAIDAEARRLASLGRPILVSFSHEPEMQFATKGTAADFKAAFAHVVRRARNAGATNVRWVWTVMGLSDPVWLQRYQQMWPGDAYVDWIAWDPYNFASCGGKPWKSFADIVHPFYAWLTANGHANKPYMLAEFGTIEKAGDPSAKPDWLGGVTAAMRSLPNLKALVYFDLPAPPASCDWRSDTSPASRTAFDQLARGSAFSWTATRSITAAMAK